MVPDLAALAGWWEWTPIVHTPAGAGWEPVCNPDPLRWLLAFSAIDATWFVTTHPSGAVDGPKIVVTSGTTFHLDYQKWGGIIQAGWSAMNLTGGVELSVWTLRFKEPGG